MTRLIFEQYNRCIFNFFEMKANSNKKIPLDIFFKLILHFFVLTGEIEHNFMNSNFKSNKCVRSISYCEHF